jgi:hypothetical protein
MLVILIVILQAKHRPLQDQEHEQDQEQEISYGAGLRS